MTAIIGAVLLLLVVVMSIALILGVPLGEFTLGGRFKVFPAKLRFVLVSLLLLQVFFAIVLLQLGHIYPLCFSHKVTKIIGIFFAVYLSLNCLGNLFSKSKKERFVMTPLSAVTAFCYWVNVIAF